MDNMAIRPDNIADVWLLVKHHKKILERRFPKYHHTTVDWPGWERTIELETHDGSITVLVVSFSSNCVHISPEGWRDPEFTDDNITLNYADPEFTDSILSDILEGWEEWKEWKRIDVHGCP